MFLVYDRETISENSMIEKTYREALIQSTAYRELRQVVTEALSAYSLSSPEWALLGLVYENHQLGQKDIAELLSVEPPLVTQMIAGLKQKDMIEIQVSVQDARKKSVSLSKDMICKIPDIDEAVRKATSKVLKGCTHEEVAVYFKVLHTILLNTKDSNDQCL